MIEKTRGILVSKTAFGGLFFVVFLTTWDLLLLYLTFFHVLTVGGSVFLYRVLLASYSLMSFVFTPFVARLSDRYGRRKILLAGLEISSLSYFIFGSAHVIWLPFAGRMLSGTTPATIPVAQAYVADVTTRIEDYVTSGSWRGVVSAAISVASVPLVLSSKKVHNIN